MVNPKSGIAGYIAMTPLLLAIYGVIDTFYQDCAFYVRDCLTRRIRYMSTYTTNKLDRDMLSEALQRLYVFGIPAFVLSRDHSAWNQLTDI